jgi:hypothetical protein
MPLFDASAFTRLRTGSSPLLLPPHHTQQIQPRQKKQKNKTKNLKQKKQKNLQVFSWDPLLDALIPELFKFP